DHVHRRRPGHRHRRRAIPLGHHSRNGARQHFSIAAGAAPLRNTSDAADLSCWLTHFSDQGCRPVRRETVCDPLIRFMRILYKRLLFVLIAFTVGIFAFVQSLSIIASKNRDPVYQELQKLVGANASFDGLEASLWGGLGFT